MKLILFILICLNLPESDFQQGNFEAAANQLDAEWLSHPTVQTARNRGRAHLLAGNYAKAIVAFRQAEELAPWDPDVRMDLAVAREFLGTNTPPTSFRNRFGPADYWTFAIVSGLLVIIGYVFYRFRYSKKWLFITCLGILGWCIIPLIISPANGSPFAVASSDRTILRAGNSDYFEPRSSAPLPLGTEVTLLGFRGGWAHVRTEKGEMGWLPESKIICSNR